MPNSDVVPALFILMKIICGFEEEGLSSGCEILALEDCGMNCGNYLIKLYQYYIHIFIAQIRPSSYGPNWSLIPSRKRSQILKINRKWSMKSH